MSHSNKFVFISCFCLATFVGAFLFFQVEPIVGKLITPQYGGTASVWIICLLFFQLVVLAGYGLTFLIAKLTPKKQIFLYLILLAGSFFWSAIPRFWQPGDLNEPVISVLISLAKYMAIPCILLTTISGIMQIWFRLAGLGNPYPLYSVSNTGSIVGLLTYPTLIEPHLTIAATLQIWTWLYWILGGYITICAAIVWLKADIVAGEDIEKKTANKASQPINWQEFATWIFFSTMGSAILLTYSNYITSEISPVPLLWILPLTLYLLTFVLVFADLRFYQKRLFLNTWMLFYALEPYCFQKTYMLGLVLNLILVFELCMICHGELVSRKPNAESLPTFYLGIAIGGVLGGIFIGIIAPALFSFEAERILIIVIMAVFTVYEVLIKKLRARKQNIILGGVIALMVLSVVVMLFKLTPANLIYRERNFYSAVRVQKEGDCLILYHGQINHGEQYLDPLKADKAAGLYYGYPLALVADFVHEYRNNAPVSFAGIGLGVGTYAHYGRAGDTITFYELDPKIEKIAQQFFSYLKRSPAKINILIGDGRNLLSNQSAQNFDLLLVDAFNGDAIPCHLLTKEALEIYLKHLKPDGLLLFHTTNSYVDLSIVLGNLAKALHLQARNIRFIKSINYIVICRDPQTINQLTKFASDNQAKYPSVEILPVPIKSRLGVWTDDFANLFSVLKFH